ncbi:MAG: hypothetical protein M3Z97_10210 [Candidatus Dormibacteraeota bacterium]|nr:hypothetical protein [Candidatus Dormibacteraeota bacterium]
MAMYVEDWLATYGSPYLVAPDDQAVPDVELMEDGDRFLVHRSEIQKGPHQALAFVDGVRRGEAALYQVDAASGQVTRGVAGSHACGGVIADGEGRPTFTEPEIERLVIWGSGRVGELPPVRGGWGWTCRSIAEDAPEAPLMALQERMRRSEGRLAARLCEKGLLVVVDGTLTYTRGVEEPILGYVKTHSKMLLRPEHHRRVAELKPGERSSLFRLARERYSCYLRLAPTGGITGPWAGIVRLEVPQSAGLSAAVEVIGRVAGILPRYASVPWRDPRAPQNLQPVGALEQRLRHFLGDQRLAQRAVREAVMKGTAEVQR